jgi:hypothetical protein
MMPSSSVINFTSFKINENSVVLHIRGDFITGKLFHNALILYSPLLKYEKV